MIEVPAPKAPPKIRALQKYVDDRGYMIDMLTEMIDGLPMGKVEFYALHDETIKTNRGPMPVSIKVPLEAQTITEAFSVFEEQSKIGIPVIIDKMKKHIEALALKQKLGNTNGFRG
jgi:hypothetical protein